MELHRARTPGDTEAAGEAEQIRLLLRNASSIPANLINAVLVAIVVWPLYPAWVVAPWLGIVGLVSLARAWLGHRYAEATGDAATSPRWARVYTLQAFVSGCLWGLLASVILMTPDPIYYNFIVFVLGGMMAGGVVRNAVNLRAMFALILPTVLPAIVVLAVRGGLVEIEMAVMLAAFTSVLAWTGRDINRSITENIRLRFAQERMAADLRVSEAASAKLAAIVESSADAIVAGDAAGTITSWNRGAEHLFGYGAEEAIGQNVRMIVPDERRAEIDRHLDSIAHSQWIAPFDTERQRKDGARVPVSIAVSLTRDAAQTVVGVSFIARDITERQAAARDLAYRDRLLHAVTAGTGTLVRAQSLDLGMPEALRVVGEGLRVDRVLIIQALAGQAPPLALRYCWEAADIQTPIAGAPFPFDALAPAVVAGWAGLLSDGKTVIAQVANSEGPARLLLERLRNKSMVVVPVFVGKVFWGGLGADACATAREWTPSEINTLRTFADIAGALLQRGQEQHALETSEARFRTVTATAQDAIITIDAAARIGLWNGAAERILGYSAEEAVGKQVHDLLAPPRFRVKADTNMGLFVVSGTGGAIGKTTELAARRKDGTEIAVELSLAAARLDDGWGAIGILRDITQRKQTEALALRMARYDVLTGLANRAVFVEGLERAIARARRGEKSFAVLYLDLDHFKDVNDTLGHPLGDELLKAVADRLRANTRETDTLARFGGDEFALIVADIRDPADAAMMADKLVTAFASPFAVRGNEIHSGVSIGIAAYGLEGGDPEALLSHADVALYRAKSEGRGGYRFFTDTMNEEVKTRVALGAELRVAIDEGQLFLMYQPQVAIDTGRITGVEALARWRHPRRGVLDPGLFIPIAEQIGIVAKIGHWVLWEACRQGKAWLDQGSAPVRIAVNISALQFRTPVALEADIAAALVQTGLPPRLLELELTESVLMDASRDHNDLLQRLRETGVTVAIDDFGTGYSSLEYLRKYPSNRIKIAQNFVTHLETTPGDAAIIRATIGLARELNIDVIAEGVETKAQLDLLKAWGCGEVQGYFFARPLTAEDAGAALRDGKIVPATTAAVQSVAPAEAR